MVLFEKDLFAQKCLRMTLAPAKLIDPPAPPATTSCLMTQQQLAKVTPTEANRTMNKVLLATWRENAEVEEEEPGKYHIEHEHQAVSEA